MIIGVGAYPHAHQSALAMADGVERLTSPPISAQAFADWVKRELRHPWAEPGDVELLISGGPQPSSAGERRPEPPTYDNVCGALQRWYDRCDENPRNVGIFYFCGHGLETDEQILLMEDFGQGRRGLAAAIDVHHVYRAMRGSSASSQYYFVDACRRYPRRNSPASRPSDVFDVLPGPEHRTATVLMRASRSGHEARGRAYQVSEFTSALLEGLRGRAARMSGDGTWTVSIAALTESVSWLMQRRPGLSEPLVPCGQQIGNGVLHRLEGPPQVPMSVRCSPGTATGGAQVTMAGLMPPWEKPELALCDSAWRTRAAAGCYQVDVALAGAETPAPVYSQPYPFLPPHLDLTVRVEGQQCAG